MRSFRVLAVVLGHLGFAGASYWIWALGQNFAPELMVSPVMMYPLILGVVGIWIWFGFWSASVLHGPKQGGDT
jgi:hypothetical protein